MMSRMAQSHGIILDVVALICITVLLALKVIPTEAGFGIFGMIVGARAAIVRSSDSGGSSGGGGSAVVGKVAAGAVAGIMMGLASALGSLPKFARSMTRSAAIVALALAPIGCAGLTPRDAAVDGINASSTLATQAEPMLAKMYRDEQKACETLKPPASPKDCALDVRARYAKAWKAYVDFMVARTIAVTMVDTYDAVKGVGVQPTATEIAKVVGDLASAESAFSAAMSTVKGASIQ